MAALTAVRAAASAAGSLLESLLSQQGHGAAGSMAVVQAEQAMRVCWHSSCLTAAAAVLCQGASGCLLPLPPACRRHTVACYKQLGCREAGLLAELSIELNDLN